MCGGEAAVVPHVERNRHHGVEDDDVAPETQEASVRRSVAEAVVQIPGLRADALVPVRVSDGQTSTNQNQQHKDLQEEREGDENILGCKMRKELLHCVIAL